MGEGTKPERVVTPPSEAETFAVRPVNRESVLGRLIRDSSRYAAVVGAETADVDPAADFDSSRLPPQPEEPREEYIPVDDKHVFEAEIGRGGMGRILKVKDVDLNRDVAMKVLLADCDQHQRFIEEAQITGQLDHPNVIPVHEFGVSADGELFFTMKFVRGHRSLRDLIDDLLTGDAKVHAEYSFERRVQLIQQVCDALHYAHERGVVHRDIKPENVVVGRFGEVYLVDWGVAKLVDASALPPAIEGDLDEQIHVVGEAERGATAHGALVGTLAYMAPEQVSPTRGVIGPWTDVYSLCALLYELLCLHHYLEGVEVDTYIQLMAAVMRAKPRAAESYLGEPNGRVPRNLSRICRKGLLKSPHDRWGSAREVRQALQLWLEGRSPAVCPGTTLQRWLATFSRAIDRRPVVLPIVSLVVGVLMIQALIFWVWRLGRILLGV
jgi:serine/threonine protein kinase